MTRLITDPTHTKTLRPYQQELVDEICRTDEDLLVEQPTGSGKTVQIVATVGKLLGRSCTHALIAAPQEQIEEGFVRRDYDAVRLPGGETIAVGPGLLVAARAASRSVQAVRSYCRLRVPGYALVCTHAALAFLRPEDLPRDLAGHLLVIDEAHHAPAAGVGALVRAWKERGARVLYFTATPFRADNLPVRLDGMRLLRRSLAEHMQDGGGAYAPRHLETEIIGLSAAGRRVSAGMFTGDAALPRGCADELVRRITAQWQQDGRPKAIVRVPPLAGGSTGLVRRLVEAFRRRGARVLDATGTARADRRRFLAALSRERGCRYEDSHDILIGIQRVLEGTDWPHCSTVYCVGFPGSLPVVVQLIGRAMRPKGEEYPEDFRDRARILFFVLVGGGQTLRSLPIDHSRHALLVSCFLADSKVGQEWALLRAVRRGLTAPLGDSSRGAAAATALDGVPDPVPADVRARVLLAMADAYHRASRRGGLPCLGELIDAAGQDAITGGIERAHLLRIAMELLVQEEGVGRRVTGRITAGVRRRRRDASDPGPAEWRKGLEAVFDEVMREFRTATVASSSLLGEVCTQLHRLTGGQMEQFARRLRDAVPKNLSVAQVREEIWSHYRQWGRFPATSSDPAGALGCTWRVLDHSLRVGHRGLPGGSSLSGEVREVRAAHGLDQGEAGELTLQAIHDLIRRHHEETGAFPGKASGPIPRLGMTWYAVNSCLYRGNRGLPGGSSLAREVEAVKQSLGLPVPGRGRITLEAVHAAIARFRREHGRWPTARDGDVALLGTTWKAINHSLLGGNRGLPRSSLAREVRRVAAARGLECRKLCKPPLGLDRVRAAIVAHHQRFGRFPSVNSGFCAELQADWRSINMALTQGLRGLPGGSSLAREAERMKRLGQAGRGNGRARKGGNPA